MLIACSTANMVLVGGAVLNAYCFKLVSNYTRQQNFTFFLAHEGKYQILIELLTLNSNM